MLTVRCGDIARLLVSTVACINDNKMPSAGSRSTACDGVLGWRPHRPRRWRRSGLSHGGTESTERAGPAPSSHALASTACHMPAGHGWATITAAQRCCSSPRCNQVASELSFAGLKGLTRRPRRPRPTPRKRAARTSGIRTSLRRCSRSSTPSGRRLGHHQVTW